MSTPTQRTEKRLIFQNCQLGNSDLKRVFALAAEGTDPASVEVSTQRNSTRYSTSDLDGLINSLNSANVGGDLKLWSYVLLEANDATGDRRVSLSVETRRVEFSVSGKDETWVLGQAARLQLFLEQSGGRVVVEQKTSPWFYILSLLGAGWILGVLGLMQDRGGKEAGKDFWIYVMLPTFGPIFLLLFAWLFFTSRAARPILRVTEDVTRGSVWSRLNSANRIALAGVIATTVIGVAVVVVSAISGQ